MSFVSTRHGTLFYLQTGKGKPFVLIHGNTMTAGSQERLAQRFADEHCVTCFELLGHGQSARPHSLFSPAYFAMQGEALADALDTLFAGQAVPVFGMSAGGVAALNTVCDDARLVSALILDSVFHTVSHETLAAHRVHVQETARSWERYMCSQHGDDWWPCLRDGLLSTVEQLVATQASVMPCMTDVSTPTLIFQGGHDAFCPERQGREIAAALPNARLIYDSQAGHILAWKYPAAFRDIVRDFLKTVSVERMSTL